MSDEDQQALIDYAVPLLKELGRSNDPEEAHSKADDILRDVLNKLGLYEITEAWDDVPKFYA